MTASRWSSNRSAAGPAAFVKVVVFLGCALAATVVACYDPSIEDGHLACAGGQCPRGLACAFPCQRCYHEPFEGLPPAITGELFGALNRLRYEVAMLVVDNRLDLALMLSDRAVILERGTVTWTGVSKLLRDDPDLRRQKLWI